MTGNGGTPPPSIFFWPVAYICGIEGSMTRLLSGLPPPAHSHFPSQFSSFPFVLYVLSNLYLSIRSNELPAKIYSAALKNCPGDVF